MGKFTTYIVVMCGLSILFYMAGLASNNPLLNIIINPGNIEYSLLYRAIGIALGAVAVGSAIGIGFVSRNVELGAVALLVTSTVLPLMFNFIPLITEVASTEAGTWISALIFGPTMIMFLFTIMEWVRGQD